MTETQKKHISCEKPLFSADKFDCITVIIFVRIETEILNQQKILS